MYFLRDAERQTGSIFNIKECQNQAAKPLNYLIPYILALVGLSLGSIQDLIVLIVLLVWLFIVYSKSDVLFSEVLFFNPMFYLSGYQMYQVKAYSPGVNENQASGALLISRKKLAALPTPISVKELDTGVIMDISKTWEHVRNQ